MILENQNNQEILEKEEEVVVTPKKKRATAKKKDKPVEHQEALVNEEGELDLTKYIEKWKQEHKRIFKNDIDGEIIIWRRLKRGEYKNILNESEEDQDNKILTKQEKMVATAVLYPFNIEEVIEDNAGLATVLSEEILAKSGFAISYTEEL